MIGRGDKMKIRVEYLALFLVSLILGLILSIQFRTINKTVGEGALPTQRAQEIAVDLKKAQTEREAQLKLIEELELKIDQYEKSGIENDTYAENLYKDAMKYRMLAGYSDVEGPGIILEIIDPPVDIQYGEGFTIIDELDLKQSIIFSQSTKFADEICKNRKDIYPFHTNIKKNPSRNGEGSCDYLVNNNSLYFVSGQSSSSTIISNESDASLILSNNGFTSLQ